MLRRSAQPRACRARRASRRRAAKSVARSGGRCTSIRCERRDLLEVRAAAPRARAAPPPIRGRSRSWASRCTARQRALQRAVAPQQLGGRLRADPRRAGQAVGGVAAQRDEVGHLLRLDAVALAHLPPARSPAACRPCAARGSPRARPTAEQVAVAGQQQRAPARLAPRRARTRTSRRPPRAPRSSLTVQPRLASSAGARSHCPPAPAASGRGGRGRGVQLHAVGGLLGARGTPRPRAAGALRSPTSSALTVPSSAFTGLPSPSTIDFGSAKYERYSSHGTSAISSGAGIGAQERRARAHGSGVVARRTRRAATLRESCSAGRAAAFAALGALPAVVPPSGRRLARRAAAGEVGSAGGVLPDGARLPGPRPRAWCSG